MVKANIEIRHLKYFVAVVEEMSFRRAALRLHISQPPLSRQVQQLEQELGVELFSRKGRGVELTPTGHLFFTESKNILALTEQAIEKTQLAGRGQIGQLDVGVFGSAVLDVIPKLISEFRRSFPRVNIVLHDMNKIEQLQALRDGRLTIGFSRFVWDEPDILKESVLCEHLFIAHNSQDNMGGEDDLSISSLKNWPIIIYPRNPRPSFADRVIELCRSRGFEPNIVQEVDDVVTAIALVSSGFGVCVVAQSATNLQMPNVVFRRLERSKETLVELFCQYLSNNTSPILSSFLDIIRSRRGLDKV